jgi:hypothetical protein
VKLRALAILDGHGRRGHKLRRFSLRRSRAERLHFRFSDSHFKQPLPSLRTTGSRERALNDSRVARVLFSPPLHAAES